MLEHEYYNIHSSGVSSNEVKRLIKKHTTMMMVEHLYFVHNMKIREISRILRYKEKNVKAIIAEAKKTNNEHD